MAKKILIDGVEYVGLKSAAKKLEMKPHQLKDEIRNNTVNARYTVVSKYKYGAEPVNHPAGNVRSVTINGTTYLSLRIACEKLNITSSTLYRWMREVPDGEPLEVGVICTGGSTKPCIINGVLYNSQIEAAAAYNVKKNTISYILATRGVNGVLSDYKPNRKKCSM